MENAILKKAKGGNLINSPCCNAEIVIHYGESNFAYIDHFSCKKCLRILDLEPLQVRSNW